MDYRNSTSGVGIGVLDTILPFLFFFILLLSCLPGISWCFHLLGHFSLVVVYIVRVRVLYGSVLSMFLLCIFSFHSTYSS